MIARLATFAVPVFLLLCLLLGGSSQSVWGIAALQALAALLIGWAALSSRADSRTRSSRLLALLIAAMVATVVVQLVPLPPDIWTSLPGRGLVTLGDRLLGIEPGWQPLSLDPYVTLRAGYALLPPIALVVALIAIGGRRESWSAGAIVVGALASVTLGAVQVASAGTAHWAYLYDYTNTGAVGVFANRNHMATLLVAAIPFAAALFAVGQPKLTGRGSGFAVLVLGGGGFLLILVGLLLNASLAALALAVPVTALSILVLPAGRRLQRLIIPLGIIALVVAVFLMTDANIRSEITGTSGGAFTSRGEMWSNTANAIALTFPAGTGVGTFPQVYALGENPANVGVTYINHAHNDYLELVLETGILGILLIVAGLAWWAWQAVRVWRSPFSTQFEKAATIASAAILAHSVVDFPLRTTAIAAVLAVCAGMMAQAPDRRRDKEARHVRIG